MDPTGRKFLDVTNYYGQMVEMDSQGRLLIPQVDAREGQADGRCGGAGDADDAGGGEPRDVHQA